jgi:splicing factor 3A subunit 3
MLEEYSLVLRVSMLSVLASVVWQKLKGQKVTQRWRADQEEEYEDSTGNVVNKKVYDDLRRQGLL